mmetsp:Transcript_29830/g.41246  ORF Transcript_29830/g.41246 Transcript_29830/m.41246 type:complete len:175 (-) Transcript_29830:172-696(-)|eukprot:CAMPEP_0196583100 /NCGR_PEP_ID=MMETSP1081-20130531/41988_1 /TAXON_ID=36882 /ORGANISM="Pyramimonas amylifera, Strain CCMP720" /LENGTH=174 /DNA_ID=CAMNT_0041903871 /DNA_START=141 /DNA_END=665 /DNA_ORIENTATION=+
MGGADPIALPHWLSDEAKMKYRCANPYTRTNSATMTAKRQGEVIAIAHDVAKTGYKADNAYGAKAIFEDETTTGYYQGRVQKVGEQNDKKKLMPYHPNASRNRPGETLSNTIGRRFNASRNASQLVLRDGDPDSLCAPKTTSKVYSEYSLNVVGMGNQGISSEVAKMVHAKQRR